MGFGLLIVIGIIALLVAESKGTPGGSDNPPLPGPQPGPPPTPVNIVAHYSVIPNDVFLQEFGNDPDVKAFQDDSTPEHTLNKGDHIILLVTSDVGPHNNWVPQPAIVTQSDNNANIGYITVETITQEPGGPPVGTPFKLSTVNEVGGYFDSSPSGPIPQIMSWLKSHAAPNTTYA